jgi:hypothetical protein
VPFTYQQYCKRIPANGPLNGIFLDGLNTILCLFSVHFFFFKFIILTKDKQINADNKKDFVGATDNKYQIVDRTVFMSYLLSLYFAHFITYETFYEPESRSTEAGTELTGNFYGFTQYGEGGPLVSDLWKFGPIKQNGQVHPRAVFTGLGLFDQSVLGNLILMSMYLLALGSLVFHFRAKRLGLFMAGTNCCLTMPLAKLIGIRLGNNILFPTGDSSIIPPGHLNFGRDLTPQQWVPIANLHAQRENWFAFCYLFVPLFCGWFNAWVLKGTLNPWSIDKATKQFKKRNGKRIMAWDTRSLILLALLLLAQFGVPALLSYSPTLSMKPCDAATIDPNGCMHYADVDHPDQTMALELTTEAGVPTMRQILTPADYEPPSEFDPLGYAYTIIAVLAFVLSYLCDCPEIWRDSMIIGMSHLVYALGEATVIGLARRSMIQVSRLLIEVVLWIQVSRLLIEVVLWIQVSRLLIEVVLWIQVSRLLIEVVL